MGEDTGPKAAGPLRERTPTTFSSPVATVPVPKVPDAVRRTGAPHGGAPGPAPCQETWSMDASTRSRRESLIGVDPVSSETASWPSGLTT